MLKRCCLAAALVLCAVAAFAQDAPKPVNTLLANAKAEARAHHKSVFVIFHASW